MTDIHEIGSIFRLALIEERFQASKDVVFGSLQSLKDYLDLFQLSIDKEIERENEELAQLFAKMTQPQREAYMAYHYDGTWHHILTSQFYYSFMIWAFAVFEQLLGQVCQDLETAAQTPIRWDELRGQNKLDQAQKYLQKFLGFVETGDELWKQLNDSYTIRNVIVHNGGWISNTSRETHIRDHILKTAHGISLEYDRLKITSDYCREIIQLFHRFIDEVFSSLDEVCDNIMSSLDKTLHPTAAISM